MKLDKRNIENLLALSSMQSALLFQYLLDPESQQYFEQLSMRLAGEVDGHILRQAWEWVIATNEMLRTIFRWEKLEKPVQIVLREQELAFYQHDFSLEGPTTKEHLLEEIRKQDREKGFDLATGPLFRVTVCKLNSTEYEMIVSNHHILYDGWSNGIILTEFMTAYGKLMRGEELSRVYKTSFREYLEWCQEEQSEIGSIKDYWHQYLAGFESKTGLPTIGKRAKEPVSTVAPAEVAIYTANLSGELVSRIDTLVKGAKVTLGSFFSAVWGILLQRYNNAADVLFGTTVAGRPAEIPGIESMVGLFINTLPARVQAEPTIAFATLLTQLNQSLQAREPFGNTSLAEIRSCSELASDENLFDSLLVLENYPLEQEVANLQTSFRIESVTNFSATNFDLVLEIAPIGGLTAQGFALYWHYSPALFLKESIRRMAGHLTQIIGVVTENPGVAPGQIEIISPEERQQLLYQFNDTARDYPRELTVTQIFEARVAEAPERLALRFVDQTLSYGELNAVANRLARTLRGYGVGVDQPVGILAERSMEMIIGVLAVVKAGGAYLPIDRDYPTDRMDYMLRDSGAKVLLTQPELAKGLKFDGIVLDLHDPAIYAADATNLALINKPEDLIQIIYTSGSTGEPKGVMIEHRNVLRLNLNSNMIQVQPTDRVLQSGSLAFDASTFEVWGAYLNGAALYLIEKDDLIEPERLTARISAYGITTLLLTTSVFHQSVEEYPGFLAGVRQILIGGEVLSPKHAEIARVHNPGLTVTNVYGPTESTTATTYFNVEDEYLDNIPIGWPLSNTQVYILSETNQLQPIGVVGELCIGGDGLGRGYLNRPELTAEKFVPNPFKPGQRMYRSGDLARWLPDGKLEFVGRIDHQVKIRGYRIELGEIEARLLRQPEIAEALVMVRTDSQGFKYLCAYLVFSQELAIAELRSRLACELPPYMLPAFFVRMDKMPLTTNGKINRRALPEPVEGVGETAAGGSYTAPATEIESRLQAVWTEVLGVGRIGVEDNFFELGGHSLKATALISRIHKTFGVAVPLKALFAGPTIRQMGRVIEEAKVQAEMSNVPPITAEGANLLRDGAEREYYPLFSAQRRMYLLHQLEPESVQYNIPVVLKIEGELKSDRFEHALQALIKRHESLRTSFKLVDGEPVQLIHPEVEFLPTYQEISRAHQLADQSGIDVAVQNFIRPFDLREAPLLRAELVKDGENIWLLLDMHHIISDGVSMNVLIRDFTQLYQGMVLPEARIRYRDYALWQNEELQSGRMQKQEDFWLKTFSDDTPVLDLPTDFPRRLTTDFHGDEVSFTATRELGVSIRQVALKEGVTVYMLLLAAFNLLLQRYTAQDDIIVGTPVAGRGKTELEEIVGMFVNTLAVRNSLREDMRFTELLAHIKENVLQAFQHQDYPFELLVEKLNLARDTTHHPLFDTMFVLQNMGEEQVALPEMKFVRAELAHPVAKFDLTLTAMENGELLEFALQYRTGLFHRQTIERIGQHLLNILKEVTAQPEILLGEVEMIGPEEKEAILNLGTATCGEKAASREMAACREEPPFTEIAVFTETASSQGSNICMELTSCSEFTSHLHVTAGKTVDQLFAEQAAATPDAVAILTDGKAFTYRELEAQANQLASALVTKGICAEQVVGIMLERSFAMVAGILAVWKAGGAYVPLDSSLPVERLRFMLEDSGACCILTQPELMEVMESIGSTSLTEIVLVDAEGQLVEETLPYIRGINEAAVAAEELTAEMHPGEAFAGNGSSCGVEITLGNFWPEDSAECKHSISVQADRSCNLAYIIYTSGTTGEPKGVMVEHRQIVNSLSWRKKEYGFREGERVLQLFSFVFDGFLTSCFTPLLTGATVVLLSDEEARDILSIKHSIARHAINYFIAVPSLYQAIVDALTPEEALALRIVTLAGESVQAGLIEKSKRLNPQLELVNEYGPTENSVVSTCQRNLLPGEPVYIGNPITNTQALVLSRSGKLLPPGAKGEICLGGAGLARGYRNRPDLTQSKFVPHPHSRGQRLYRTGDFGKWQMLDLSPGQIDARLEFLGRMDQQVKIRGYRIELSEIESVLLRHPAIREGAVVDYRTPDGAAQLVAYYVADEAIPTSKLKAHLAQVLPEYMLPSSFICLERLPLNASGKLDRRALPKPGGTDTQERRYLAPQTPVALKLAELWADVLGVPQVGLEDNFFELGGHSLKASILIARIAQVFNVELPLRVIFKAPTLQELAGLIENARHGQYLAIQPASAAPFYPVSSTQKRMFVLHQIDPASLTYNMPGALVIEGGFERERFAGALSRVIQRHEVLRTAFQLMDGEPVQVISPQVDLPIEEMECWPDEIDEVIQHWIKPFRLDEAPLLRVGIIKSEEQHVLIFDMHHIISDGTSMAVFIRELVRAYEDRELPPLSVQYKDYAVWQQELLNSESLRRQETYWLNRFGDELPVLMLPIDYPRPALMNFAGDRVQWVVEGRLSQRLHVLGTNPGTTLYMTLLAAYTLFLARYSGQEDIIVGTPVAGRTHANLQEMLGMFVNTLALRNQVKEELSFIDYLHQVKEDTLQAFENQDYPFEMLVEKLNLNRDMSKNPLFDTMFVLQNTEQLHFALPGAAIREYPLSNNQAKLDLTLDAAETPAGLQFTFEYKTALWKRETIERLARNFTQILHEIIEAPETPLRAIQGIAEEEKQKLLYTFNTTQVEYPENSTVEELFRRQAYATPEHVALRYGEEVLTYSELNEQASQVAAVLKTRGVGPETIVGLMVERSFAMLTGIFGIWKAGGAYLPLDPAYPPERLSFMLEDSGCKILLSTQNLQLPEQFTGEIIFYDPLEQLTNSSTNHHAEQLTNSSTNHQVLAASNVHGSSRSENLAYVIYTSGTTGKPKGVLIEHGQVLNTLLWRKNELGFTPGDRALQVFSFSFDGFLASTFPPLLAGAEVVLVKEDEARDPETLKRVLQTQAINYLTAVPSLYQAILECSKPRDLQNLRKVSLGGEKVQSHLIALSKKLAPEVEIINEYGPTENSIASTYQRDLTPDKEITIGRPIANTRVYIVNSKLTPVPLGAYGELCVAGVGVARGYLNRPDLTQEKFVQNPFIPGERMYRTGDLARWSPDGSIEFVGRLDHQVKIRGFRIELGEIETVLNRLPQIKEGVVVDRKDPHGNPYLAAYYTVRLGISSASQEIAHSAESTQSVSAGTSNSESLTPAELRTELARELPEYMIPTYFVHMDNFPLTPNGKIDRKALPAVDESQIARREYIAPTDPLELKLAQLWAEVLGIEQVGVNDHFFELGGHSLKATALVAKVAKELQMVLPMQKIFDAPVLKDMAQYIRQAQKKAYTAIHPVPAAPYYPVSSAQQRLYVLNQFESDSTNYNLPALLKVEGSLERDRLEAAFKGLILRHEPLRTSFEMVEGKLMQVIQPDAPFAIEVMQGREAEVEEVFARFIRPFDLQRAPLLRVGLLETESHSYLLIDLHHIIADGVSREILTREFAALYAGETLPPLRIQYKDFAHWQNQLFQSSRVAELEAYWLTAFAGELPVLNLPTDYQRPTEMEFAGDAVTRLVNPEITKGLRDLAAKTGATLYMTLLAAYTLLLAKYTGQEDIIVGSPIAGRPHADLENILGMFVNTLAMRNAPKSSLTFKEYLVAVKTNALQAFENQEYQFEMLVEKLHLERAVSRNPLFDTMFALQNLDGSEITIPGLTLTYHATTNKIAKFDLNIAAAETEEGLIFNFEYRTRLFTERTVSRMAEHLENILQALVTNPEIPLARIEIISPAEKSQLLYEYNRTQVDYPVEKTMHQLFEEQAERTPENIALVLDGQWMTYRELNARANQLARLLSERGIRLADQVGIIAQRSFEMIIGLLAILKAGAAYVPIDPTYPLTRQEYIAENSEITALVVDQQYEFTFANTIQIDYAEMAEYSTLNLDLKKDSTELAYIIYTSGSTGLPKGVMIEHHSAVNLILWVNTEYGIGEDDALLFITSMCFDLSVYDIFGILAAGGRVVIAKKEQVQNSDELRKLLLKERITFWDSVPTTMNHLVTSLEESGENYVQTDLRVVFMSGDWIPVRLPDRLKKYFPRTQVISLGGATEGTVWSIYYPIESVNPNQTSIPYGKPLNNNYFYVLDKDLNVMPVGLPGELFIGGVGVARGYINNPERTEKQFLKNPFLPGEKAMLYRTGDLGRMMFDGNIEFLGRVDHQVKIRGFRIEMGEIEYQILRHPAIKETVIIDRKDSSGNKYLVAYLVAEEEVQVQALRQFLAQSLPDYMIPTYFIQLAALPLTSNGKIDRKSLPEPGEHLLTSSAYVAPAGAVEESLVQIWQELLEVPRVGAVDNFFELGGHSLKATGLVARVNKEFQIKLPLKEVFKSPTVRELAKYIKEAARVDLPPIEPQTGGSLYPVSSSQKRLWIMHQLHPDSISYNLPWMLIFEGEVDYARLEQIFQTIIARQESFRTSFEIVNGTPEQRIHEQVSFAIRYLEAAPEDLETLSQQFIQPFDLEIAPLFRVAMVKFAGQHLLMMDMHHIISDGVSLEILTREFVRLYAGEELPALRIQYKDYAVWQQQLFRTGILQKEEEYWLKQLAGLRYTRLPEAGSRLTSDNDGQLAYSVEPALALQIQAYCNQRNITRFILLLTVFKVVLLKASGEKDLTLGIPTAGRTADGLENIIGLFLNVLPIRTKVAGDAIFADYLETVKATVLEAQDNQNYPFEEMYVLLKEKAGYQGDELFSIMFNYLATKMDTRGSELAQNQIKPYHNEKLESKYAVTLYVQETDGNLSLLVAYKAQLYEKNFMQSLLQMYIEVLEAVLADDTVAIAELGRSMPQETVETDILADDFFNDFDNEDFFQ